jgi:hypothetical protein
MRITKSVINSFEEDQRDHGTEVALHNILWQLAAGLLKDLGATKVTTTYHVRASRTN